MPNRTLLLLALMMNVVHSSMTIADTYTVTNTSDSGPGSFRQAILVANEHAGADSIIFQIPVSDSNYDAALSVWKIAPMSTLPTLSDDSTTIDGSSQASFIGGDPNPHGPEIELDGANAGEADGLRIISAGNIIKNLVVNRFRNFGIQFMYENARFNVLLGCYIGSDVTGTINYGNAFSGVVLYNGAKWNIIGGCQSAERNVISGNGWAGVEIQSWDADSNRIIGNYIGTDASGLRELGNNWHGVYIWSGAQANIIGGASGGERNLISANHRDGIYIGSLDCDRNVILGNYIGTDCTGTAPLANGACGITIGDRTSDTIVGGTEPGQGNLISCNRDNGMIIGGSCDNIIAGNYIGTDPSGLLDLGNSNCGVLIYYGSRYNIIGPNNVIANNGGDGIRVQHDTTTANTIMQNRITGNAGLGIENIEGGNAELVPPLLNVVSNTAVSGTTAPNSKVEIYSDTEDEGGMLEGEVISDAAGNFFWTGNATGPHVTAIVTDASGNTSEFSRSFPTDIQKTNDYTCTRFALHQNHPNPFNPITRITYQLPKSLKVKLVIINLSGQTIKTVTEGFQDSGVHSVYWDGRDDGGDEVASGVYLYRIQTEEFSDCHKLVVLK